MRYLKVHEDTETNLVILRVNEEVITFRTSEQFRDEIYKVETSPPF